MPTAAELLMGLAAEAFDPAEARIPGGEHGGEWSSGGVLKDILKLAGKIELDDGEQLLGSNKVNGDAGTVRLALIGHGGHRSLRLGVGGEGFGARDDPAGPWHGGPDTIEAINAGRKRLSDERDRAAEELDRLAADPHADRARKAHLEARINELDDMDLDQVEAGGYTAQLDQPAVEHLRSTLADALAAGAKLQAEFDADREPTRPARDYWTLAEGSIPGDWADVHYEVYFDDPSVGTQVVLGAVPHGADFDLGDMRGSQAADLDAAEARKLLRQLGQYAGSADQSRESTAASLLFGHSPALAALEAWDELLHPRGPGGKFAKLGDAEREARRVARNEARKTARAAAKTAGGTARVVEKPHTHDSILTHARTMSDEDLAALHHAIAAMHHDRQAKAAVSPAFVPTGHGLNGPVSGAEPGVNRALAEYHGAMAEGRYADAAGHLSRAGMQAKDAKLKDSLQRAEGHLASNAPSRTGPAHNPEEHRRLAGEHTRMAGQTPEERIADRIAAETTTSADTPEVSQAAPAAKAAPTKGAARAKMAAGRTGLTHSPTEAAQRIKQMGSADEARQYLAKATRADLTAVADAAGVFYGKGWNKQKIHDAIVFHGVQRRLNSHAITDPTNYRYGASQ